MTWKQLFNFSQTDEIFNQKMQLLNKKGKFLTKNIKVYFSTEKILCHNNSSPWIKLIVYIPYITRQFSKYSQKLERGG